MELNDKQQALYRLLKAIALMNRRSLAPEELEDNAKKYGKIDHLSDEEIEEVTKEYKQREGVSMPHVSILEKEDNDKWFEAIQNKKELFVHWNRYSNFLGTQKGFSDDTLKSMGDDIEKIISHFANPHSLGKISKKGLVVGDVQSGKTANYIGLINMAVDVGYRTIVLLTGLTEDLRIQTQGRIDEGFVGAKSETFKDGEPESFGVSFDGGRYGVTLTSINHDFISSTAASISAKMNDYKKPVVSVIKKNKKVINTLNQFMSDKEDRQESPLLIIDDECDNASINTKDPDSPTSINEKIRELFSLYRIVTYVGYSATPFANIFVDPDANYKVEKNDKDVKPMPISSGTELPDLFPDDFIVLLEPPSNYIGAMKFFKGFDKERTKGIGTDHIIEIGKKGESIFPARHKITDFFTELAPSLKDAINVFLLSNVVYSIRKHEKKHRSMLINISRFNDTQAEIAHVVWDYVSQLRGVIQAYSSLPLKEFLLKPELKHLYDIWMNNAYFGKKDTYGTPTNEIYDFDAIRTRLYSEICLFEVAIINGTIKKRDRFKYDLRKDVGARVIVIGGFSLSRGLTLEGLMTSYYNRNATAFDVLLQMGRWFGYRPDYEDLVNVFMTQSSIDAFCAVSESTEDLKEQFRRMAETKKTPREFGLMVREAPDTLDNTILITSRNKMKNSEDYVREISLSGSEVDTSKINVSLYSNVHNRKETESFFKNLQLNKVIYQESSLMKDHFYYKDVPAAEISAFLSKLDISYANNSFDQQALITFIGKTEALKKWDVVVATGESKTKIETIAGKTYSMPSRSFLYDEGDKYLRVGGKNNRLLDPGIFKVDLDNGQLSIAKESAKRRREDKIKQGKKVDLNKDEDLIARDLLDIEKRKPLLVVFPLDLNTEPRDGANKEIIYQEIKSQLQGVPAYGFGIGFPGNFKSIKTIYRINIVKKNAIMNGEVEDNEDENFSDEENEQS